MSSITMPQRAKNRLFNGTNKGVFISLLLRVAIGVVTSILFLQVLLPAAAPAHEIRPIIATLGFTQDGNIGLILSLNLEAAIAGIGSKHKNTSESTLAPVYDNLRALPADQLLAEFDRFEPTLLKRIEITIDGNRVALGKAVAAIPETGDLALPRISTVTFIGASRGQPRSLSWRFDPMLGDSVMRVRALNSTKIVRAELVTAGAAGGPVALDGLSPQTLATVFATYVRLGFVHIVPKGLDHILFVLGLFLLSKRISPLLWQVSAFTLAHTVTLALGATGVVTIPPTIVEPLIAASIVYVAVENLFTDELQRWRPPVVFGFGLLHGLGFAGVLGEIGLSTGYFFTSLIAFNLGVELGQIAVIAAAFFAIGWAARKPWFRRVVTKPASLAIAIVASFWVLQRTGVF